MTTLLHISASPRGQRSESLAIAATFLEELRATHPDVTVEHWDLWDGTLPAFGPPAAAAKMAVFGGADPEGDEATAWRAARDTFERFDSADYYSLRFKLPKVYRDRESPIKTLLHSFSKNIRSLTAERQMNV